MNILKTTINGNFDLYEIMTKYKFKELCVIEELPNIDIIQAKCNVVEVGPNVVDICNMNAELLSTIAIVKRDEKFEITLTELLDDKLVIEIPGGFNDFNNEVSGPILMIARVENRLMPEDILKAGK